ncbi:DivIVA domain-containing protein [Quadrisphaera sp. KR29]|uniref:DivIVA domain-containing protein n=1 Tax=Quadrisphaera sp. KR29 TaxID=3461391 RepID=UPI004043B255
MADTGAFRTVLRGYDPAQVEQHVHDLEVALQEARGAAAELSERVQALEHRLTERAAEDAAELVRPEALQPTYADLGARVAQILALSEEEAGDVVARAEAEAGALRSETEAHARLVRLEADRYEAAVRSDADLEAQRVLADAQLRAEELLDAAERDAAARREESEAAWEDARARAAQAAADFELALATRRHRTEVESSERARAQAEELERAERLVAQARDRADAVEREVAARTEELLASAREEAAALVEQAREHADQVRAQSQREVAAAAERRDSINAQLANVRQMLATLSGGAGAPAGSVPVTGLEDGAAAGEVDHTAVLDLREDEPQAAPRR